LYRQAVIFILEVNAPHHASASAALAALAASGRLVVSELSIVLAERCKKRAVKATA
jgi:hypothetical protein